MPPRRKRADTPAPTTVGHLERTPSWHGLKPGDAVDVSGTRLRSATWTFVAHVRNSRTGEEWVEVVGGRPGDRMQRSFRPGQVYPPGTVRSAGRRAGRPRESAQASLADAPRLPLD